MATDLIAVVALRVPPENYPFAPKPNFRPRRTSKPSLTRLYMYRLTTVTITRGAILMNIVGLGRLLSRRLGSVCRSVRTSEGKTALMIIQRRFP